MQDCDNVASDSGPGGSWIVASDVILVISFLCCLKVCPHFFLLKHREARDSFCLDVLITWLLFLHQREPKGERWGLFLAAWGAVTSSSSHHSGRRCSRLGVRWYLMWRGPVSFPDILSWVHCCTAPILHRSQSRSHQMALKSEAEGEKENIWRGRRTKIARNGEKMLKRRRRSRRRCEMGKRSH